MRTGLLTLTLGLVFSQFTYAGEIRFFRLATEVAPEGIRNPKAQVFIETDKETFVCINILLHSEAGFCGSPSVKECYRMNTADEQIENHIQFVENSLREYRGTRLTPNDATQPDPYRPNYLYSFGLKDLTNSKQCQVSVAGGIGNSSNVGSCNHVTMRCF